MNASCDQLPTSLVLINCEGDQEPKVLGHSRINTLPNDDESVWIESVIIHQNMRGKGYGKILMMKTESYASSLGFKAAILSTHGEEEFYKKLGYTFCSPVALYGGIVNKIFLPKCFVSSALNNDNHIKRSNLDSMKQKNLEISKHSKINKGFIPPPPPLPSSQNGQLKKSDIQRIDTNSQKVFMRKTL